MTRINIRLGNSRVVVILSGAVLFGIIVLISLNQSTRLSADEAEERVRLLLWSDIAQRYVGFRGTDQDNDLSGDMGRHLAEELARLEKIEFVSIEVNRLIPDFLLKPHRPTHIVRVEMRIDDHRFAPRYFWLSSAHIDRETSKYAWYFSF